MKRVAALIAGVVFTTTFTVPAYATDEEFPPLPPCSLEAAKAVAFEELYESYLAAFEDMAQVAEQWQRRAMNREVKIDRLREQVRKMRDRLQHR